MYKRAEYQVIKRRLEEPRKFIQVVMGPRQVGKSTVVKQVLQDLDVPFLLYSAYNVPASNSAWVSEVKSNAEKSTKGLDVFRERFKPSSAFIVGEGGIHAEDFLTMDLKRLF